MKTRGSHPLMQHTVAFKPRLAVSITNSTSHGWCECDLTEKDLELPLEVFVERYLKPAYEAAAREMKRRDEEGRDNLLTQSWPVKEHFDNSSKT